MLASAANFLVGCDVAVVDHRGLQRGKWLHLFPTIRNELAGMGGVDSLMKLMRRCGQLDGTGPLRVDGPPLVDGLADDTHEKVPAIGRSGASSRR